MFLLRTITGICKLCRSEHGAALVVEPASPELQPSPDLIAVSEPGPSLSSLREQSSDFVSNPSFFRSYLQETFFHGEETGVKANPADIACKMRSQRSSNGDKLFSKEEWFSTHQVARYFGRLSALNKSGVLKRNVSASQEEEEDLDYISEVEAMETRFQIRRELEL